MHSVYGTLSCTVPSWVHAVHTILLVLKQELITKLGRSANAGGGGGGLVVPSQFVPHPNTDFSINML